ncbi:hypothetical protein [Nocardia sp. NPDC004260]
MAAELLEERGDLPQALTWFNMAVTRLSDDEMAERDDELGFLCYANNIIAGRRRIRQALGLPSDDLDTSVESLSQRADEFVRTSTPSKPPREMRVLFWPRPEIPHAHETWPQLVEPSTPTPSSPSERKPTANWLNPASPASPWCH